MHNKERFQSLYQKFLDNTCSLEEFEELVRQVGKLEDKEERSRLTYEIWKIERARQDPHPSRYYRPKNKTSKKSETAGKAGTQASEIQLPAPRKSYRRYKVAAILLMVITSAFLIYQYQHPEWWMEEKETMLESVTPEGRKSAITLTDGSKVKLNAGSKLIYPKTFKGDRREIRLEGEAFFEIARDEKRPFVIRSGDLVTSVLGTSFNIKAYPEDEFIQVAVASGEVVVTKADSVQTEPYHLKANTVASYDPRDNQVKVESRNVEELLAWKDGVLLFKGERMVDAVKTLEKWYGVKIILDDPKIGECTIVGEFRNKSLQDMMKVLKLILGITYEISAEGVSISGKGCGKN